MPYRVSTENRGATPAIVPSGHLIWPIPSIPRVVPISGDRCFGRDRGGDRYHSGIDLIAPAGAPIVAPEAGMVVAFWYFYHGTCALTLETASQELIFGEVAPDSLQRAGLYAPNCLNLEKVGLPSGIYPKQSSMICGPASLVQAGQIIAYVGLMSGGSHMLHFEIYKKGKYWKGSEGWDKGTTNTLDYRRDPTPYLLACKDQADISAGQDAMVRAKIEATSKNSNLRKC